MPGLSACSENLRLASSRGRASLADTHHALLRLPPAHHEFLNQENMMRSFEIGRHSYATSCRQWR